MGLKTTTPTTNGEGKRALESWIDHFVEYTDNLEAAPIWRKWAAISTLAATMEQKVYVTTSSPLFPNMYVFLVGDAGLGKTRPIIAARGLLEEIPDVYLGPTSTTMASLVDHMSESKRTIIQLPDPAVEYNTLYLTADELSAFMHEYNNELIAGLTTFYDCVPYSQGRRTGNLKIKIKRPQLNILSGSTPSNLIKFIPEGAWEQGFTSRVMLIYSAERPMIDVFNTPKKAKPVELVHDLKIINNLAGQFGWTDDYAKAMNDFREDMYSANPSLPVPNHPKLKHYVSRRFAHLIKVSMVACVDRSNELLLTKVDFNRSISWLLEAEATMPEIFRAGAGGADSKAMDEILYYVQKAGPNGVSEQQIINFARQHVQYINNVINVLGVMERSGLLVGGPVNKRTGMRVFTAG